MRVYKDGAELLALWQYDQGVTVSLGGLAELPTVVEFTAGGVPCITVEPTTDTVDEELRYVAAVPDVLLEKGLPLFIYAKQTEDEAHCTVSLAVIPVRQRPPAVGFIPADDPSFIDVAELKVEAEMKANKVQRITAAPTDEQYPSALAVMNYVAENAIPVVVSPNIWELDTGLYWIMGKPQKTTTAGWNFAQSRHLFYIYKTNGGVRFICFDSTNNGPQWQAPICGYSDGTNDDTFALFDTSSLDLEMPVNPTDTHTMSTKAIKAYIDEKISEVNNQ